MDDHTSTLTPDHGLSRLLSSPEGQLFLRDLIFDGCQVHQSAMNAEPAWRDYTLGRQSIGLELIARLDALDPQWHTLLMRIEK